MPVNNKVIQLRKLSQQYAYTSLQMHETIGRGIGLSGTDHKYLGCLVQKGPLTAGELSTLTGLTTGAVTGLIDRFEKRKLVKRQPDKTDRRKILVVPDTNRIIALLKPFYSDFQNNTDKLFSSFSSAELEVLESYFNKALKVMNGKIESLNRSDKNE